MVLSTHSVVGAGLAIVARANPITAFVMGFLSHFVLDAVPHWDYKLVSKDITSTTLSTNVFFGKDVFRDLALIGSDILLGLCLIYFVLLQHPPLGSSLLSTALWGAVGAMFPDFLQFVYFKIPREPFVSLQKFHVVFMHAKVNLDNRMILGPLLQCILMAAVICVVKYFVFI